MQRIHRPTRQFCPNCFYSLKLRTSNNLLLSVHRQYRYNMNYFMSVLRLGTFFRRGKRLLLTNKIHLCHLDAHDTRREGLRKRKLLTIRLDTFWCQVADTFLSSMRQKKKVTVSFFFFFFQNTNEFDVEKII